MLRTRFFRHVLQRTTFVVLVRCVLRCCSVSFFFLTSFSRWCVAIAVSLFVCCEVCVHGSSGCSLRHFTPLCWSWAALASSVTCRRLLLPCLGRVRVSTCCSSWFSRTGPLDDGRGVSMHLPSERSLYAAFPALLFTHHTVVGSSFFAALCFSPVSFVLQRLQRHPLIDYFTCQLVRLYPPTNI